MPYAILSHTADTGIAAKAPTLADLIREVATGMFSLIATAHEQKTTGSVELAVEAASTEDLVVDVLAELLWRSEAEDLVFTTFDVDLSSPTHATVVAHGTATTDVEPVGPPIKAVTYHDLSVVQTADGWEATVYFDV